MTKQRIRKVSVGAFAAGGAVLFGLVIFLIYLNTTLPEVESELINPEYALPTTIYDRNGTKIKEIFVKRRKLVTYGQVPVHLINGLIAKEDSRFFDHHGIDPLRMLKAAWVNLLAGRVVQGASTLTQQTARQFFLTLEKSWIRKISEILLALRIEREFSKETILTLYLNKVNFGDAYGVQAAAEVYFDKSVEELSLSESSMLIGLLPSPNRYKPTVNPLAARQQRNIVLTRMADEGFIDESERQAASTEPIVLAERGNPAAVAASYYVELVRRKLISTYGTKSLYEGGLHVYTAMDMSYQTAAHLALNEGVRAVDRRQGYRGPLEQIEFDEFGNVPSEILEGLNITGAIRTGRVARGVVVSVEKEQALVELGTAQAIISWERMQELWKKRIDPEEEIADTPIKSLADAFEPGDMIQVIVRGHDPYAGIFSVDLYQEPRANGSVYSMNPQTGEVLAMVGGIRYGKGRGASEFIRATQAKRQPGSVFKPVIYAAAIDEGYSPATILDDSPRVFTLATGVKHIPQNYDGKYLGRISLRGALFRSRNVPTVQLVDEMGARKVIEYARRLGITTDIPDENIIALGTHSIKLAELTRAYGVFAAQGRLAKPIYILRVEDSEGNVLEETEPEWTEVLSEATSYIVADILRDVVRTPGGTAHRAMRDLTRPAAGKTGTTQNYTDAWYIGFIPQLVSGVYIGFDDPSESLGKGETGSRAAAPVWLNYMTEIEASMPIQPFEQPPTVVSHMVNRDGQLLGPCEPTQGAHYELFNVVYVPERISGRDGCYEPKITTNGASQREREDPDL